MTKQSIQTQLVSWLIKARFSFTGIGSATGVVTLFILASAGLVMTPNWLVWASFFVIGGGLGLAVDELQNRLTDNE